MREKDPIRQAWETVEYIDDPDLPDIDNLEQVPDFLPKPEELVFRPKGVKGTLTLSEGRPNHGNELIDVDS